MVRAAVVANFVILGPSPLTTFILALRVVLVDKLVISGILSTIFFTLALYIFQRLDFFTASLSLLKSAGTSTNLSTFFSNYLK